MLCFQGITTEENSEGFRAIIANRVVVSAHTTSENDFESIFTTRKVSRFIQPPHTDPTSLAGVG